MDSARLVADDPHVIPGLVCASRDGVHDVCVIPQYLAGDTGTRRSQRGDGEMAGRKTSPGFTDAASSRRRGGGGCELGARAAVEVSLGAWAVERVGE